MNKVANFERISFEQFESDMRQCFPNITEDNIKEAYDNIRLPERKTIYSAGHDFHMPFNISVLPNDTLKIPTGIRCKIDENYVMLIYPRSSLGIKHGMFLPNTTPVIDSDYYEADNEGHIFIAIKNNSHQVLKLKSGDAFVQAVFIPYGIADNDEVTTKRTGGIGSTTE